MSKPTHVPSPTPETGPISRPQRTGPNARTIARVFFGFFLLAGLVACVLMFPSLWRALAARGWEKTPCTIISSEVKAHHGSDSTTYSIEVRYAYEVFGNRYESDRYRATRVSSSGRAAKDAVVARLRPGTKAICYVNPADPSEAVLDNSIGLDVLFGLIPLAFLAVGGGGLYFSLRRREASQGVAPQRQLAPPLVPSARNRPAGRSTLKPGQSRLARLILTAVFTVFWNGIVLVFVLTSLWGSMPSCASYGMLLFIVPFIIVGVVLIGALLREILGLLNPQATVTVSPETARLGDTVEVQWEMRGRTHVLQQVRVYLEGRERATYRRGTNTATDTQVFATIDIAQTTRAFEMDRGRARLTIPRNTMHTFKAANNQITWRIVVHGQIPRWPDVKEEFELEVLPLAMEPQP